jgi:adenosylmethionine-8-amino-7-oxononanoate aminotransferase
MPIESEEKTKLRNLTLDHVWVPARNWNVIKKESGFNIFTEGKGCRVTDIDGKSYIDYWSGLGNVSSLGYGIEEIAEAVSKQINELHYQPTHELAISQILLAKKLADICPGSLSRVFFANSGTEAVETAIKIARKFQKISGFSNRHKIIVGGYRYHGSTYGAMSLGTRAPTFTWEDFEPLVPGTVHVCSPYCFKCDLGLTYPSCDIQCAKMIEKVIKDEVPETVAAFLDVTIASEYSTAPPDEYWPMVRKICDKYGILLILDEIMMGFGRTGKMFACEHWNVVPDIMLVAKSLTNGTVPLGAAIVTKEVAHKFEGDEKKLLKHSFTFSGHPVACAAGLVSLEIIERENLVENSKVMGKYLFERLRELRQHKIVGNIRGGLGLDCSIEFVKNNDTNEKLNTDENKRLIGNLKEKLRKNGLWGPVSNPLQLRPALIVSKKNIDEIIDVLNNVFTEIKI